MTRFISFVSAAFALITLTQAAHGISTHGKPKYPADFKHFAYVNPSAPKGGTLRMGTVGTFNSVNPFILKGTPAPGLQYLHTSFVFGSLTTKSDDEPSSEYCFIAEDVSLAADRSYVDFTIRKAARFSDGNPITAHDVVFSFDIFKSKGTPIFRQYYKDITKAEALNDHLVRFHIGDPQNAELPVIIGHMPIISKKFWSTRDFANDTTSIQPSSGAYIIKSVNMGKEITLERIKGWWAEKLPVMKGRFNPDEIKMITMMDDSVMFEAFKAGRLNFRVENNTQRWQKGYDFPAVTRGEVRKQVINIPVFSGCSVLYMNARRQALKDVVLRRALHAIFDFPQINRQYFAGLNRNARSYFAGSPFEGNKPISAEERAIVSELKLEKLPRDYEKGFHPVGKSPVLRDRLVFAHKLLKKAGYTVKAGQLYPPKGSKPITLELIYPAGANSIDKIMQDIVRNARRLGVTIKLRTLEPAQLIHKENTFDFDLVMGASVQSQSPANEQRDFWSCRAAKIKGSKNLGGLCDLNVDKVIEHVIDSSTLDELRPRVQLLDRLLLHSYTGIPLWHTPVIKLAMRKEVKLPKTLEKATQFDLYSLWIEGDAS